ncbi:16S rRNA (cytosine(1402)-N(4))-methyltransferase RsmH [Woodsholea maritima]|uniref:16S rRNA (cytosine(1402)-N(4))-methyltransferase RsmH n=1 Tax=Woodsholea maritima TaxID=240237 RepID=UPI0003705A61|nr:16S rRNA (cytosine(1402)-N(4))-methyltransferase RsmH [Woodsholea maritima]
MDKKPHISVMLDEVLHALEPRDGGLYVDGTFGAGGYTRAVLGVEGTRVLGIDRDPNVRGHAEDMKAAFSGRFALAQGPFSTMKDIVEAADSSGVDGVMLDLGVSSMQLDQAERGFSFQKDGPLDMRMAQDGPSAADAVNLMSAEDLAKIFWIYGEERHSRRVAAAIVRARTEAPITTTLQLASIIESAVRGKKEKIHPATRSFQGLRIYINDELGELWRGLSAAEQILKPAGRLVVVTFHSLEDRIVKTFMRERAGLVPRGSRHTPDVSAGPEPSLTLIRKKALEASAEEAAVNARARSAKLRAAIRTQAEAFDPANDVIAGVPPYSRLLEL